MAETATARAATAVSLENCKSMVGTTIGVSSWHLLSQSAINLFADITSDMQYIHVDELRAKDGPFGGTIVHGMLSLSMISAMFYEAVPVVEGASMSVNYGFDKVRFPSAVPVGSRVRARVAVGAAETARDGSMQVVWRVTIEREDGDKPAVVADWIVRLYA